MTIQVRTADLESSKKGICPSLIEVTVSDQALAMMDACVSFLQTNGVDFAVKMMDVPFLFFTKQKDGTVLGPDRQQHAPQVRPDVLTTVMFKIHQNGSIEAFFTTISNHHIIGKLGSINRLKKMGKPPMKLPPERQVVKSNIGEVFQLGGLWKVQCVGFLPNGKMTRVSKHYLRGAFKTPMHAAFMNKDGTRGHLHFVYQPWETWKEKK